MPDPIEGLGFVEEGRRAVLFSLKGGGDGVYDTVALLDCRVLGPKPKLVVRNHLVGVYDRIESAKEKFFQYFS